MIPSDLLMSVKFAVEFSVWFIFLTVMETYPLLEEMRYRTRRERQPPVGVSPPSPPCSFSQQRERTVL